MPKPSILRGYIWDAKAQTYLYAATRTPVARARIVAQLERSIVGREHRVLAGLQAFADGDIAPSTFLARSRTLLKRQYLQNASLGSGGWDRLTFREYGRIGGNLRWEMERMRNMAQELAEGKISIAQATNRMHMYLGNARREFYRAEQEHLAQPERGKAWVERRYLDPTAIHCDDCKDYAELGWQPLGVLPPPGDNCQCDGACRCNWSRRQVPVEELYERVAEGGPGHHEHEP